MKIYEGVYVGPDVRLKGCRMKIVARHNDGIRVKVKHAGLPPQALRASAVYEVRLADLRPLSVDERPGYIPPPENDFAPVKEGDLVQTPLHPNCRSVFPTAGNMGEVAERFKKSLDLARAYGASEPTIKQISKQIKEQDMKEQMERKARNLAALVQDDYTTAQVLFITGDASSKRYTYKVPRAWNVQRLDALVVETPSGLGLVTVVEVDEVPRIDVDAAFTYKWAVQPVDRTEHDERNAREEAFAKRLAEVELIRRRDETLDAARKALGTNTKARKEFDKAVRELKA